MLVLTLSPGQASITRYEHLNMIILVGLYAKLINLGTDWTGIRCTTNTSTTITQNWLPRPPQP